MEPLIDICIPLYNSRADYLAKAVESAFAQTEQRWRMYFHDDASTMHMEEIIKPYLKDSRISWHPNRKKLGIGGNWNATMRLGSAPFVQFLFPDDWWEPNFLEMGLKIMNEHPDVGMVSLEHEYYCKEGADTIPQYKQLEDFRRTNIKEGVHDGRETLRYWVERQLHPNIIGEPDFVMLRRSLLEKVGPYLEDMPQNLDMEYSLRCLLHTHWYYVPQTYGYFRVHAEGTSAINQKEGKGVFDRFRCFEELIPRLSGADRKLAINARNQALEDMAGKFLNRVKTGGQVKTGGKGGGAFKKFAMKHPFLITRALWNGFWKNRK